jgi:hypothetical protein
MTPSPESVPPAIANVLDPLVTEENAGEVLAFPAAARWLIFTFRKIPRHFSVAGSRAGI